MGATVDCSGDLVYWQAIPPQIAQGGVIGI